MRIKEIEKLSGMDFGQEYLDENGKWMEKDFDGNVYIEIGYAEKPEYDFTIENGSVTVVSFAIEIKNNQNLLSSYEPLLFFNKVFGQITRYLYQHILLNLKDRTQIYNQVWKY